MILRSARLAGGSSARLFTKSRVFRSPSSRILKFLEMSCASSTAICGPKGVISTGAWLVQLTSTSNSFDPGSLTRRSEISGAVCGGSKTDTSGEAEERASTSPSWSSRFDQATARYQIRLQPGVTLSSVKVISSPVALSVLRRAHRVGAFRQFLTGCPVEFDLLHSYT